jgi:hypothetical protein
MWIIRTGHNVCISLVVYNNGTVLERPDHSAFNLGIIRFRIRGVNYQNIAAVGLSSKKKGRLKRLISRVATLIKKVCWV